MMTGRELGPYTVGERVGVGAAGEVYRARDRLLEREVAIKFLSPDWVGDDESEKRFLLEARAAARLSHPGIVRVHAIDMEARPPYMVIEYVDGPSLEKRIQREGRIAWREALDLTRQTCEALAVAHAEGIIHRDIKPGNILLDSKGQVHVTDFGLARLLDAQTRLTTHKVSIGSPAYMSPEQCRGEDVTPGSDLFGLGITLFEMLAGRLPYMAPTAPEVAEKIVDEPLPKVNDFAPDVPQPVQQLLEALTAKNAAQRYPSARAVVKHLDRLLDAPQPRDLAPPSPMPAVGMDPLQPSAFSPQPPQPAADPLPQPAVAPKAQQPQTPHPPHDASTSLWKTVVAIAIAGVVALIITWLVVRATATPPTPDEPENTVVID